MLLYISISHMSDRRYLGQLGVPIVSHDYLDTLRLLSNDIEIDKIFLLSDDIYFALPSMNES